MKWLWISTSFILATVINILYVLLCTPVILLNENQILYTFSTIAQVTGGLFGLILAAYAIMDPKLKDVGNKDQVAYDFVEKLRLKYFEDIIILSIICGIAIFMSLFCINAFHWLSIQLCSFIINQTLLFFILGVACFLTFGCYLLNPKSISKIGEIEKEEIEKEYSDSSNNNSFKPFISYYNKLEDLIILYANELMQKDLNHDYHIQQTNKRIPIFQALDILLINKVIDLDAYYKLDELRRYRNALVHSLEDQTVNSSIFEQLKNIYDKINIIYQNKENIENKTNAIKELSNYVNKVIKNDSDIVILHFLKENPNLNLNQIANKLGVSRSFVTYKIKRLRGRGLL